ncbi:MAG TPA: LysM domain-containing protein [Bacilli bacterium]|nr:LysM domain-containing protein [Bacilli bacterium]
MYYTVRPGDNLWSIAQRFRVPLQQLMQANNITNPSQVYIGQRLLIPTAGVPGVPPRPPGGPNPPAGGWQQRVERLEREVDRLQREVNRLENRVARLERAL